MPAGTGFVRHPGEGEVFNRITFKAGGADTDGRLAVAEDVMEEEGQGAFLVHAHSNCDEAWWVLEGEVIFLIGDEQVTAPMGAFVFVPRGVFHCYWNPRSTRARVMMQWMPAGMEHFFADQRQLWSRGTPELAAIVAVWEQHGIVLLRNDDGTLVTVPQLTGRS